MHDITCPKTGDALATLTPRRCLIYTSFGQCSSCQVYYSHKHMNLEPSKPHSFLGDGLCLGCINAMLHTKYPEGPELDPI